MSGFIGGDRDTHYAYGAARSIHAGDWDPFLLLLQRALDERRASLAGEPGDPPSMAAFIAIGVSRD
jgi:hypothetical protein